MNADIHAYYVCGRRHSRLAPCPRTMTRLCLGIDEAIQELRTALLLPKEWLQSRLSFSSNSPPCSDHLPIGMGFPLANSGAVFVSHCRYFPHRQIGRAHV